MASRIDVELTSVRDDGTWTWRVAGAREPRGVLDGALLHNGASVGDIVRVEAEFGIDGITVSSVLPPKAPKKPGPGRLEILGPGRDTAPVTTSLVGRRRAEGRSTRGDTTRRPREGDGAQGHARPRRDAASSRAGTELVERGHAGPRRSGGRQPEPSDGRRPDLAGGDGRARTVSPSARNRPRAGSRARSERTPRRLSPATTHRDEVMRSLPPERRPIAEQLLRGGMPAVRQALAEQNRQARQEGRPEVRPDALLALAEELLPRLKVASWLDRAEAVAEAGENVSLRDLRSVVAGSEAVAREDATRALAASLREKLGARLAAAREEWLRSVGSCLEERRLVRALKLSSRPPDPTARIPADLAARLRDAATDALSSEPDPQRWISLLEAVAASPVRRVVKPSALPAGAGPEVLSAARRAAGQVPSLAPLLGIEIPPPPGPPRRARPLKAS